MVLIFVYKTQFSFTLKKQMYKIIQIFQKLKKRHLSY